MIPPERLLELAETLVRLESTRPRQASLRRSISTSSYAVFPLLTDAYSGLFPSDEEIRAAITRTLNHKDVDSVAQDFANAKLRLPKAIAGKGLAVPAELVALATAFVDLQDERHDADYDTSLNYALAEALDIAALARRAFADWEAVRKSPAARIFLACFQLKKTWDVER